MAIWTNNDGLRVRFGVDETVPAKVTEYRTHGPRRFVEILIDPLLLPTVAENSVILDDSYTLPEGAQIEDVDIFTSDDFTAGTGTLNIGIIKREADATITTDVDALVVAATVAELNTGGRNVAGWVGDRVANGPGAGLRLENMVWLTWEVDTAAIVGGFATVRVYFSIPKEEGDTLAWDKTP